MWKKRYQDLDELYQDMSGLHRELLDTLDPLFDGVGAIKILQWNIIVWKFPNKSRCYFNHYGQPYPILGFSGGASLVKDTPVLAGFFDEIKKYVGKIELKSTTMIQTRGVADMILYMANQ